MHIKQDEIAPLAIKTETCAFPLYPGDEAGSILSVLPGIPVHRALEEVGKISEYVGDIVFDIERGKFAIQDVQWALSLNLSIAIALLSGVQNGLHDKRLSRR